MGGGASRLPVRPLPIPTRPIPIRPAAVLALALGTAGACQAPDPNPPLPRQWIEVGLGPVQRDEERTAEVEDSFGYLVGGGWDWVSQEHLRAGLDLGFHYARHDVDAPDPSGDSPHIDAWTWLVGARLQADAWPVPFGAHVRAGGFWRAENDFDGSDAAVDQGGAYLGAGLDWWFKRTAVLSFFVLHLAGSDDLDETQVGLSARFLFAPEPDPGEEPDWWW
jgi:hypothetical protein